MDQPVLSARQKRRITSILKQHSLLFGAGIAGDDVAVETEAAELTAALDALDERQTSRVASILRQHALLFGQGMVLGLDAAEKEDERLIRALRLNEETSREAAAPYPPFAGESGSKHSPRQKESDGEALRPYPLNGRGRRARITERAGLVVLVYRQQQSDCATIVLVPLPSVKRLELQREPVELWISGEAHVILLEPFMSAVGGHREWPSFLGDEPVPATLLPIRTRSKDRICLGMRPRHVRGVRHVIASADTGTRAYFFPEGKGQFPGLTGFLSRTFTSGVRIGDSDADGTAYFAVKRIVGRI